MTGYEPLNTIKPVAENIWIVDGEAISFYGLPYSTRMTVVRLSNGDLFLHSPIALDDDLKHKIDALGRVRHLVSPNWIHYAYLPEWAEIYTETISWASPGVRERARKFGVPVVFDRDLGDISEVEWSDELEQMIVRGNKYHEEVVFFHKPSQTLILTDLIENFEARKIPIWFRPLAWLTGILDPDGKAPIDMRLGFLKGKRELRQAVQRMIEWAPERVILSHGRWYAEQGVAELKRAFRWVLPK